MFHIELRKFPHSAWRFNLSEGELRAILVPWARDEWTEVGERNWNPHESKMTILEGPKLEPQDISMGRGWRNAQRRSEDITDKTLSAFKQAEHERASAIDNARIEEAARVQVAAREGSATGSSPTAGRQIRLRAGCSWRRCSGRGRRSCLPPGSRPRRRRLSAPPATRSRSLNGRFSSPAKQRADAALNFCSQRHGGRSSVGRAPGCGPGGRGFESRRSPS